MTDSHHAAISDGWLKLALLWIGSFLDGMFSATGLQVAVSLAVLVLTVLQIVVTYRKLYPDTRAIEAHTDNAPL